MIGSICRQCRLRLQRNALHRAGPNQSSSPYRQSLTTSSRLSSRDPDSSATTLPPSTPLSTLLSKPTWSVQSLLPRKAEEDGMAESGGITSKTLRHLLRLSALPPPRDADDEARMISTLSSQLHFVRAIQSVDTSSSSIEPLRAIRDETAAGLLDQTITIGSLRNALDAERILGHSRRPRRKDVSNESSSQVEGKDPVAVEDDGVNMSNHATNAENWDVLAGASEIAGSYFVVRTGNGSVAARDTAN